MTLDQTVETLKLLEDYAHKLTFEEEAKQGSALIVGYNAYRKKLDNIFEKVEKELIDVLPEAKDYVKAYCTIILSGQEMLHREVLENLKE